MTLNTVLSHPLHLQAAKLELLGQQLDKGILDMFQTLALILNDTGAGPPISGSVSLAFLEHPIDVSVSHCLSVELSSCRKISLVPPLFHKPLQFSHLY